MTETAHHRPAITALAPWFGGKRNLAATIAAELGDHRAYWEPCCGSMAVLLAKDACSYETVNDLHGDLINLARVIADDDLAPRLYARLQRTLMAEDLVIEAGDRTRVEYDDDGPDLPRAYDYFLASWASRNGVSGTDIERNIRTPAVRWTANGGAGPTRWAAAVESLPWWHYRLRRVLILRRDLFDVLEKIDDQAGGAVYIDPPYLLEGHRTGSTRYIHEFDPGQHTRLAKSVARFARARIVISYYDAPGLDALYPPNRWTRRTLPTIKKNLSNCHSRGEGSRPEAPEVLLINGSSYAADEGGLFG